MSSLWTPGGEHRVSRSSEPPPPSAPKPPPGEAAPAEPALSDEEQARLADAAQAVAEARARLGAVPADVVVANHLMGLYELAAIHLSKDSPDFDAARLAIDAFAAVLERCAGRLGEAEPTLVDARAQIQLAFASVVREHQAGSAST